MQTAKESGIRVELLLTEQNLNIYLELWSQFSAIDSIISKMVQQGKDKKDISAQESQLKEQIISNITSNYGQIPQIIITAVENDVIEGYTQSYIDALVSYSESIMKDRNTVWRRKKKK